jgi:hypothetical protein
MKAMLSPRVPSPCSRSLARGLASIPRSLARGLASTTACLALLSAVGCGEDQYALVPSWAVNGLAPSQETCDLYGIETVRLTIKDGAQTRTIDGACARALFLSDGFEYGGFITTKSFDYDIVYPYWVDMLDRDGKQIIGFNGSVSADYGDVTPVELPTLELFSPRGNVATVTGSYSFDTGDLAQACDAAGIETVELWVYSVLDYDLETPDRTLPGGACASGQPGPAMLDIGDYQIYYVALDANLNVVTSSEGQSVYVDGTSTVSLEPAVLQLP